MWKNYYLQGFHQASDLGSIIINKEFRNKLPADLQAIIKTAAKASVTDSIAINIHKNAAALKVMQDKHGVTVRDTPKDLYPAFLKSSKQVLAKYSAKDPFFKKVVESQKKFAALTVPYWTKLLGLYKDLGEAAIKK